MKLIDKDAVVAEIEKRIEGINPLSQRVGVVGCSNTIKHLRGVLSFINTLEVKEVDLEKEIEKELETRWRGEYLFTSKFRESAKHFFELGLKAQENLLRVKLHDKR